jgi:aryl-alcohol dehydrogenase-like predicted oxidoreductase
MQYRNLGRSGLRVSAVGLGQPPLSGPGVMLVHGRSLL